MCTGKTATSPGTSSCPEFTVIIWKVLLWTEELAGREHYSVAE